MSVLYLIYAYRHTGSGAIGPLHLQDGTQDKPAFLQGHRTSAHFPQVQLSTYLILD